METKHKLGLIQSPPDDRDYQLSSFLAPVSATLPESHSYPVTSIKNQGGLGSCASFTGCAIKEVYDSQELGRAVDLSEQHLYGEAKKIDGLSGEGTCFRYIFSTLKNIGVCEEAYFPYEERYPPAGIPSANYLNNAAQYKISSYAAVNTDELFMKIAIFKNGPVAIGITVYESFYNTGVDGIVRKPSGKILGGHAMLAIGYNPQGLVVKNSWGTSWGNKGFCTIPWGVWNQIKMEAWTIVDISTKPWSDWPDTDIELGFLVKQLGLFRGYPDGAFYSYRNVTQRQVALVADRVGLPISEKYLEEYSTTATRGWVHSVLPQLTFTSANWDLALTRYQLAVLIGRYVKGVQNGR